MIDRLDIRELPGAFEARVTDGQGFFPVIAALGDDRLLVVLRGGAGHVGRAGRLDVVCSDDGGRSWSPPLTVADSEQDDRNPALGVAADGMLTLAYHWQGSYDADGRYAPSLNRQATRVVRSTDGGGAWCDDRLLDFAPLNGASPYGKIRDVGGVLYMPIYTGSGAEPAAAGRIGGHEEPVRIEPATSATCLLRSADGGRTWGDPSLVALGLNEADFLVLPDGTWLFAGRSEKRDEQAIYICRSIDGGGRSAAGRSWTLQGRVTEAMEHPPDLTLLGNGWVLLTFGYRRPPYGVQGILSRDGGRTWDATRLVFADGLPNGDCGYPSTARLPSGRLVTAYYAAGLPGEAHDSYSTRGAYCHAVGYDETALIRALER
jgi:hypothetical protein